MKTYVKRYLVGFSQKVMMHISARFGHHFPMHILSGYPRSGTTWFIELLEDYLNMPQSRHDFLPSTFSCVIHNHVPASHRVEDCIYAIPDGRDSLVSACFVGF